MKTVTQRIAELSVEQEAYTEVTSANSELDEKVRLLKSSIIHTKSDITRLESEIEGHITSIGTLKQDTTGLETEKSKLKAAADIALGLINRKKSLLTERSIQEIVAGLLKDSGIKSAIIREYIPILNRLINKYLAEFGFFINFTLDENFDERILSRGRDDFSYNSFSEGEKTKIDLSILFAFRQITELKNSANCNLLFLDEMGDSALDLAGKEAFVYILSQLENGNNFVISHNAPDNSMYDQVISVSKRDNFSVLRFE
jgi:DNA repair exonuclease SbcCD ATPase subunit